MSIACVCFQHANLVGGELNAQTNVNVAMRVPRDVTRSERVCASQDTRDHCVKWT